MSANVRPPTRDGHVLLLLDSEPRRRRFVADWVSTGLDRDEKVFYLRPDEEHPHESLAAQLAEYDLDITPALADGRIELLPVEAFYPSSGWRGQVERALAEGFPAVRMSGEARTTRTHLTAEQHLAVEAEVERLSRELPLSALCQYDGRRVRGPALDEAVVHHPMGVHETLLRTHLDDATLRLEGEVDHTNSRWLAALLRQACAEVGDRGTLTVDLGDLAFLDVSGYRSLLLGSAAFRQSGGLLRLLRPRRRVTSLLSTLFVHYEEGIDLVESGT
ncbi:MAG: MEDS domain-containing protein [Nocardioidaceae bacterium]